MKMKNIFSNKLLIVFNVKKSSTSESIKKL